MRRGARPSAAHVVARPAPARERLPLPAMAAAAAVAAQRPRPQPRRRRSILLALLVLLAAAGAAPSATAQQPGGGGNETASGDVEALVQFMAGISSVEGTLLAGWDVLADPCVGGWPGVVCSCTDLPHVGASAGCNSDADAPKALRVRGLDLGPLETGGAAKLSGNISGALGSLGELVYLDLSDNNFSGTLPEALANLSNLQLLLIEGNQISGTLPPYLGSLPALQRVLLGGNRFWGPVPPEWCGGAATYALEDNKGLCGALPKCLTDSGRVPGVSGTYLSGGADDDGGGGACDTTPPVCDQDAGCTIWTPRFWASPSVVSFNFTGFMDYESSVVRYAWCVGTRMGLANVVPLTPVTSDRVLKGIKYNGGSKQMFVTPVVFNLSTVSLLEGHAYYVTVVAYNGAGPPLATNTSSKAVFVDTSGPEPAAVYNTFNYMQASTTRVAQELHASWDNFTDPQSGVEEYVVQFFQQVRSADNGSLEVQQLTDPISFKIPLGVVNRVQVKMPGPPLDNGVMYFVQVTAINGAGLSTTVQGLPIRVSKTLEGGLSAGMEALVMSLSCAACIALGIGLSKLMMRGSLLKQRRRDTERQQESKALKALMYALVAHNELTEEGPSAAAAKPTLVSIDDKEVCFVCTDIENSTEMSSQDPVAFKHLQEIHDQVMREGIAKHYGYEVVTEGDSFQVVFSSSQAALAFSTEIQYRLLETNWPENVMRLNACKTTKAPNGRTQYNGPRVRMGVHWAREGTVAVKLNQITRHRQYAGVGIHIAMEIGDAANGGQILVTEDTVAKLSENMAMAGFPVIRLLGMFRVFNYTTPTPLYSVSEVVGRPLMREATFKPVRKVAEMWPLDTYQLPTLLVYNINLPPLPNERGRLAFVVLRLATYPKDQKRCELPKAVQDVFDEVFAIQAQQFKGYLFQTHDSSFKEGIWTAAFQRSMDAMRFTHAAQMLLMHTKWPDGSQPFFGESMPNPDGRWLFQGPRVCMAIHESPDYYVSEDCSLPSESPRQLMSFAGPAITLPLVLTYAGRGGQVILSETAWDAVKPIITQHPGAVSAISLGTHIISDDFPVPMLLMEVMPNLLSQRSFSALVTKRQLEPSYRDAPDPANPMAIVFVKVSKPAEVVMAEKGVYEPEMGDADLCQIIKAYQMAVSMYTGMARRLLKRYSGYECKEPEPGKFTLAFRDINDAVTWACHLQEELLYLPWPSCLLRMRECREVLDARGQLLWRGLRVRVGMGFGKVGNKKPLNTGRADYFGVLPNSAARAMATANPGQVLLINCRVKGQEHVRGPQLPNGGGPIMRPDGPTTTRMQFTPGDGCYAAMTARNPEAAPLGFTDQLVGPKDPRTVTVTPLGWFRLKGLEENLLLYQASGMQLASRSFKLADTFREPPMGSNGNSGNSGSFGSKRVTLIYNMTQLVGRATSAMSAMGLSSVRSSPSPSRRASRGLGGGGSGEPAPPATPGLPAPPQAPSGSGGRGACRSPLLPPGGLASSAAAAVAADSESPGCFSMCSGSLSCSPFSRMAPAALARPGSPASADGPVRSKSWLCTQRKPENKPLGRKASSPEPAVNLRSSQSELLKRHALQAAAAHSHSVSAGGGGSAAASPAQRCAQLGVMRANASSPELGVLASTLSDPLMGTINIPPIQTAVAPAAAGCEWTETPSSAAGASPLSPYTDASAYSPLAPRGPNHSAFSSHPHLRVLQVGSFAVAGSSPGGSSGGPVAPPGWPRADANPAVSVDTSTMSGLEDLPTHSQLMSHQQQAQANMRQLIYGRADSELSFSSSYDTSRHVRGLGLLAGVAGTLMGSTSGRLGRSSLQRPTLRQLLDPAKALIERVRRGTSRRAAASMHIVIGGAGAQRQQQQQQQQQRSDGGSISEDRQQVLQEHGMLPRSDVKSSWPPTPISLPGSTWAQDSIDHGALASPNTCLFVHNTANTFMVQRQASLTSAARVTSPWGQRGPPIYPRSQAAGNSNTGSGSPVAQAAAASGGGGSFTYAAGSYSPHHFQPGAGAFGGSWQQQADAALVATAPSFHGEPSLNGSAHPSCADDGRVVSPDGVQVECSFGGSPAEAAAAPATLEGMGSGDSGGALQAAAALNRSMWDSFEAKRAALKQQRLLEQEQFLEQERLEQERLEQERLEQEAQVCEQLPVTQQQQQQQQQQQEGQSSPLRLQLEPSYASSISVGSVLQQPSGGLEGAPQGAPPPADDDFSLQLTLRPPGGGGGAAPASAAAAGGESSNSSAPGSPQLGHLQQQAAPAPRQPAAAVHHSQPPFSQHPRPAASQAADDGKLARRPKRRTRRLPRAPPPAEQLEDQLREARGRGGAVYTSLEYISIMRQQQRERERRSVGGIAADAEKAKAEAAEQERRRRAASAGGAGGTGPGSGGGSGEVGGAAAAAAGQQAPDVRSPPRRSEPQRSPGTHASAHHQQQQQQRRRQPTVHVHRIPQQRRSSPQRQQGGPPELAQQAPLPMWGEQLHPVQPCSSNSPLASAPALQHSSDSSVPGSPQERRQPGDTPSTSEQQVQLLKQLQQHEQVLQQLHRYKQQPPTKQQQQQRQPPSPPPLPPVLLESRHSQGAMVRPSPLGDLRRSCSGNMPGSEGPASTSSSPTRQLFQPSSSSPADRSLQQLAQQQGGGDGGGGSVNVTVQMMHVPLGPGMITSRAGSVTARSRPASPPLCAAAGTHRSASSSPCSERVPPRWEQQALGSPGGSPAHSSPRSPGSTPRSLGGRATRTSSALGLPAAAMVAAASQGATQGGGQPAASCSPPVAAACSPSTAKPGKLQAALAALTGPLRDAGVAVGVCSPRGSRGASPGSRASSPGGRGGGQYFLEQPAEAGNWTIGARSGHHAAHRRMEEANTIGFFDSAGNVLMTMVPQITDEEAIQRRKAKKMAKQLAKARASAEAEVEADAPLEP